MCKYCEVSNIEYCTTEDIIHIDDYKNQTFVFIDPDDKTLNCEWSSNMHSGVYGNYSVPIEFCPHCGRKL